MSQTTAPAPPTITYKEVSKALQFITDRAKPVFVPVLCKLWDATNSDIVEKIAQVVAEEDADGIWEHSTSNILGRIEELKKAGAVFRLDTTTALFLVSVIRFSRQL